MELQQIGRERERERDKGSANVRGLHVVLEKEKELAGVVEGSHRWSSELAGGRECCAFAGVVAGGRELLWPTGATAGQRRRPR